MNRRRAPVRPLARVSRAVASALLVVFVWGCASSSGGAASAPATASPGASAAPSAPAGSGPPTVDSAFAAAYAVGRRNPILAGVPPRDTEAIGQGSYWDAVTTDAGFRLTYTVGWGDCMAGCISSHTFVYDVSQQGEIELVRESGDAIPPEVVASLGRAGSTVIHQGLIGRVVAGPTCPVAKPDDPSCAPRAVPGAILVLRGADGSEVARIQADEAGLFAIELPLGDYVLQPQPVQGLMGTAAEVRFRVGDGQAIPLEIAYDTGIR